MTSWRAVLAPIVVAVAVAAGVLFIVRVPAAQVTIRADLDVSGGTAAELFLNGGSDAPLRAAITPGRRLYEFSIPVGTIKGIRLDPADASGVDVQVFGLEVIGPDGRSLAAYPPSTVATWYAGGLETVSRDQQALRLRSTNADPMLIGEVPAIVVTAPAGLRTVIATRLKQDAWLPFAILLPLLILLEIRPLSLWLTRVVSIAGVILVWPVIYRWVGSMDWGSPPIDVAISRASYLGLSLRSIQMSIVAGFVTIGLAGAAVAFWRPQPIMSEPAPPLPGRRFAWLAGLAIVLLTVPDLPGRLAWFRQLHYTPHWDYDNVLTWAYWIAHGQLPFRDFWYPYAGLFLFDLSWPAGPLIQWAADAGRYAVFASALMMASGRRWPPLVATSALIFIENLDINFAGHRYLLGINVVLAFVGAHRREFRGTGPIATIAAALLMPLVLEPAQLIYAAPGLIAIVVLDLVRRRRLARNVRALVWCGGVLALGAIPLGVIFWHYGMLADAWAFYRRIGDTVQYSALPTVVSSVTWPEFPLAGIVAWVPAAMLIAALVEVRRGREESLTRASAMIGLAVLDYMVLQKHLVRPIVDTLIYYLFVGGLTFATLSPVSPRRGGWRLGAAIGLLAALVIFEGRAGEVAAAAQRLPQRVSGTLGFVFHAQESAEANRERFAPERFALHRQQLGLVGQLQARVPHPLRLFALTDDPILYVLTNQAPMWQANLYNGSLQYEQRRVVESLRANPPDFVIASRTRMAFDEVPHTVRLPEILAFAVENFVPDAPVDQYTVLRPRRAGESVPITFWQEFLGDTINVGMVPHLLQQETRQPCVAGVPCEEVLNMTLTQPSTETSVYLPIAAGDLAMKLRVRLVPGATRYTVPLSRLWPAVAARAAGLRLDVTAPAGVSIERVSVRRDPDRLY